MIPFFRGLASGQTPDRSNAITTDMGKQKVDTCEAFDTERWETGVKRGGLWYVVEAYDDEATARKGHEAWVQRITDHPDYDIASLNEKYRNEWAEG